MTTPLIFDCYIRRGRLDTDFLKGLLEELSKNSHSYDGSYSKVPGGFVNEPDLTKAIKAVVESGRGSISLRLGFDPKDERASILTLKPFNQFYNVIYDTCQEGFWIEDRKRLSLLINLVKNLCTHLEPLIAFLDNERFYFEHNFDPKRPFPHITSLCWLNYFSSEIASQIDAKRLSKAPVQVVDWIDGSGVLVILKEDPYKYDRDNAVKAYYSIFAK